MVNKGNVPYYVAGALATLTLLASGVFAAAPYIGFLAPVAALSVGLPFIIGCAVFSVVTIALSCKAISKNKIISEKDAQLAKEGDKVQAQEQTISELEAKIQAQEQTISGQNDQLTKKEAEVKAKEEENPEQKTQLADQAKEIEELKHKKTFVPQAMKDIKEASQEVFTSVAEAYSSGRIPGIVKRCRSDVANDLKNVVGSVKNAYGASIGYTKGALNSVGSSMKNAGGTLAEYPIGAFNKFCGAMPSTESVKGALGSVGNKLKNGCGTSIEYVKGELGSDVKNTRSVPVKFIGETFNSSFKMVRLIVRSLAGATTQKAQPAKKDPETSSMQLKHNQNEAKPSEERELTPMKVTVSASEVVFSGYCKYLVRAPLAILRWPVEKLIDNACYYGKYTCNYMPSAESARNWVPSLKTAGWIAGANGGFDVAGNSSSAIGNPVNGTKSGVPILTPVCPKLAMQCQIDEYSNKLENALKSAENNFGMSEEDNTNNKNEPQSVVSRILSIPRNLWGSISNLISGSNKVTHNHSEPQWSKDLHKSEDLEEIIDGSTLDNSFSSRVDNSINTSKQQCTFIDSVELKRLTKELPPSAYPSGPPRAL